MNRFQQELVLHGGHPARGGHGGVLNDRIWSFQQAGGKRVPVELKPIPGSTCFTRNDILVTREQRAFLALDMAGECRRLAAERVAEGHLHFARIGKDRAAELVRLARKARIAAATARAIYRGLTPTVPYRYPAAAE